MMKFVVRIVVSALALWVTTLLLPGISAPASADTGQTVLSFLGLGAIFTLVTMLIRPVLVVLSLPLYVLTLGLFSVIVNALVLLLSAWLGAKAGWGLDVANFGWAILGGIVIALALMVVDWFLPKNVRR